MTIKKQFILLSSIITAIPLLCSLFVIIYSYQRSSKRYLLSGSQQLSQYASEDDMAYMERALKQMPSDVETLIYCPLNDKVIYSSISEIPKDGEYNSDKMWEIVNTTSDKYFYQFSSPPYKETKLLYITRIPRNRQIGQRRQKTYTTIVIVLFVSTIISLIVITFISRTIFKSIIKIETKTQQLADGKLEEEINLENVEKGNEITSILKSLELMRRELVEIQERKNRFIMGISHDLRTPVAVIKGYSEAITDGVISDEQEIKNTVSLIDTQATQLGDMIDTLINFMKLNNTETKETLVPHSITELISEFAKYAEVTGTVFKRKVTTDIKLDENIVIPLNIQLVNRSFENIFSNAIRYTEENDSIEIISYIEKSEHRKKVIVKIQDSGTGIDEKDLNSIFDLFFRGTNSRLEEGLGIGLSVVKTIMDSHGWKISVESKKGEGSCFTITIPC